MIAQSQVCRYPVSGLSLRAWCHWSQHQSLSVTGDQSRSILEATESSTVTAGTRSRVTMSVMISQSPEVSIQTDILTDTEETVSCNSWLLSEQADSDWAYCVHPEPETMSGPGHSSASVTSCSSTERSLVSSGHTALWDRRQTSSSTSLGRFGRYSRALGDFPKCNLMVCVLPGVFG